MKHGCRNRAHRRWVVALAAWLSAAVPVCAWGELSPMEVVRLVNARDQGEQLTRTLEIELTNRRGQARRQTVVSLRKDLEAERRVAIFYQAPASVRDTALLIYDYASAAATDDQWLYMPSLRKVRRISAADRGDYFLGTDLTYDDIKNEGRLVVDDYTFELLDEVDDRTAQPHVVLEGTPATAEIADALGYSRVRWVVDTQNWTLRRIDMWDVGGNHLKTVVNGGIRQIEGIWTVTRIDVSNHKTGHSTGFEMSEIDYRTELPDRYFEQSALRRGI